MSLELISATQQILKKVEDLTNKKFQFVERKDLPTYATVKMARKNMESHIITYKAEHDEIIHHIIAHECGHIIRMHGVPEEKRVIPMTNEQTKMKALQEVDDDIQRLSTLLTAEELRQLINMWYEGLVRQLTNVPPDLMIEKWLYNEYPDLRTYQLKSIQKQHKEAIQALSDEVRKITPKKIYDASNVMNYAFFRILGFHFGINFVKPYNNSRYLNSGKKLTKITEENYVDSYEGDVQMINRWADYFHLNHWFQWTDFQDIPDNYSDQR